MLALLSTDGVRTARTGYMYVDIYLYTDGVSVACGAFSCSCGGLWCWLVACVWMYQGFVPCGDGGVVVYICIYVYNVLVACMVVVWWWFHCAYMDRYIYNGGLLAFCACVYLSDDTLLPKTKQFSRINTIYMQKSAENRIFCMDICKTIQKIKI